MGARGPKTKQRPPHPQRPVCGSMAARLCSPAGGGAQGQGTRCGRAPPPLRSALQLLRGTPVPAGRRPTNRRGHQPLLMHAPAPQSRSQSRGRPASEATQAPEGGVCRSLAVPPKPLRIRGGGRLDRNDYFQEPEKGPLRPSGPLESPVAKGGGGPNLVPQESLAGYSHTILPHLLPQLLAYCFLQGHRLSLWPARSPPPSLEEGPRACEPRRARGVGGHSPYTLAPNP